LFAVPYFLSALGISLAGRILIRNRCCSTGGANRSEWGKLLKKKKFFKSFLLKKCPAMEIQYLVNILPLSAGAEVDVRFKSVGR
jgi:hypothetical protein